MSVIVLVLNEISFQLEIYRMLKKKKKELEIIFKKCLYNGTKIKNKGCKKKKDNSRRKKEN